MKLLFMIGVCSYGISLLTGCFIKIFNKSDEVLYIYMTFSWFVFIAGLIGIIKNI